MTHRTTTPPPTAARSAQRWTDALGIPHRAAGEHARIVSLVPSLTELLFALGLGPKMVGRTTFCVHPRSAVASVPRVGGTKTVKLDRLRALEPSHVLVNVDENRREDVDLIAGFVPHVLVTHPIEPRDNLELFRGLAAVFGRHGQGEELVQRFEAELEATRAAARRLPRRRVLYLIWKEPWMTVSRPTYISRMLSLVNWDTVGHAPRTRYPEVSLEGETPHEADLILLSSEPFPFKPSHREEVRAAIASTRPDRRAPPIAMIDGEYASWYGSRAIAGLRYLRALAQELVA